MLWSTTRVVQLLSCQLGMAVPTSEGTETLVEGASRGFPDGSVEELVMVQESVHLGPFQTVIIEGWVMITPLRVEGQPQETKLLPLGLHILHAYTRLRNSSARVSLIVRNVSDSHIFLKKGVPMVQVVSASLVLLAELSPEMEAALGVKSRPKPMSLAARQEKLLEKLNLDGMAHWSQENVVAARELVLAYHDVFTLESNELGCTSAIEHEIRNENDEPFKEQFRYLPLPLLEELLASLRDMLEAGAIHLSQSPWCNMVVWSRRKMVLCISAWTSGASVHIRRKTHTPFLRFRRPWKAWGIGAFFVNGFQVRLLADQDGPRIATVHGLHGGEPCVL